VRLINASQLSGFSKKNALAYFLQTIKVLPILWFPTLINPRHLFLHLAGDLLLAAYDIAMLLVIEAAPINSQRTSNG
jgi:hypothetical protein